MIQGALHEDAQAILLLTSHLALPVAKREVEPLSSAEWNRLTAELKQRALRPADLLDWRAPEFQAVLALRPEMATRLESLLNRRVQLAFELERLQGRGIWVLTRSDDAYPAVLKKRLKKDAPPVLFGAGPISLLEEGDLAVVGSRDVDEVSAAFASSVGKRAAQEGMTIVSGGAKGVDRLAMEGALSAGGKAVGVLSDSLERAIRDPIYLPMMHERRLVLVSAVHPGARFTVPGAMARNKYIYGLSRYGLVVKSDLAKGGTRAGAHEVLRHGWVPLFVRQADQPIAGNEDLIRRGGLPFPSSLLETELGLREWFTRNECDWRPSQAAGAPLSDHAKVPMPDLYALVLHHLLNQVKDGLDVVQVAAALAVVPEQAHEWLRRAEREGHVHHLPATGRFALGGTPAASQLQFDV